MKMGKIVRREDSDKAVKVETRIKNFNSRPNDRSMDATPVYDNKLKGVINSSAIRLNPSASKSDTSITKLRNDSIKRKPDILIQDNQAAENKNVSKYIDYTP